MTVSTTNNRKTYTGDGVSTVFAFPYKFIATTDIKVYVAGVLLTSGYTVGTPSDSGANITFSVAPANGASIVLVSDPDLLQSTALPGTGPLPSTSIERMSDKLTLIAQRLKDLLNRSMTLADSDISGASLTLPSPSANKLLAWNASGTALQNVDSATIATLVASGNPVYQIANGGLASYTLLNDPGTIGNIEVFVSGVRQYPGIDYNYSGTTLTPVSVWPAGTNTVLIEYGGAVASIATVLDGTVTPAKLSTGHPSWDISGVLTAAGLTVSAAGGRILGDFSNATIANRVSFQTSAANSATTVLAIPSGSSTTATWDAYNSSDPNNASYGSLAALSTEIRISSTLRGSGSFLPLTVHIGGAEAARFPTAGGFTISSAAGLGYGTGAGGTVTQATSRTTAVTLNKPTGAITLVSAAGTTSWQSFTVNNSLVAATDNVVVNQKSGTDKNLIHVTNVSAGSFQITFATTGGTTVEQPVFNFSIIKGATS